MSNFPMGFSHKTAPFNQKQVDLPTGLFTRIDNLIYAMNHMMREDKAYLIDLLESHPDDIKEIDLLKISALEAIMQNLEKQLEQVDKIRCA